MQCQSYAQPLAQIRQGGAHDSHLGINTFVDTPRERFHLMSLDTLVGF